MMDDIDRKILNLLQEEFPLTERPYEEIGKAVGVMEEEVLARVRALKEAGYIRRIGLVLEKKKLGLTSTLCGTRVVEEKLAPLVEEINAEPGVTHNYEREGDLNLWFTVTKNTRAEIDRFLARLERNHDIKVYRFPEKQMFKIKTFFPL
jgi:siroheme decarboxylase